MSGQPYPAGTVRPYPIDSVEALHTALQEALRIEFTTIPAYLCGWWTVRDRDSRVSMMLQRIVIAEMRHMAIAANVLTAVGGTPRVGGAVPRYPALLPDIWRGRHHFLVVELLPFGPGFLAMGKSVERPAVPPEGCGGEEFERLVAERSADPDRLPRGARPLGLGYRSIGEFYEAVRAAIEALFGPGPLPDGAHAARQVRYVTSDNLTVLTGRDAMDLVMDIVDEGEGDGGEVWDANGDLSHYFTFDQIERRTAYRAGDRACRPTGDRITVPGGDRQVVPMAENPTQAGYPPGTPAHAHNRVFNELYTRMVDDLDRGFGGAPDEVRAGIGRMHQLRALAERVFACPAPGAGAGVCAGPSFETAGGT